MKKNFLKHIFIASAAGALAACGSTPSADNASEGYSVESDHQNKQQDALKVTPLQAGNFAETLPDGISILHIKEKDEYMLAIKDENHGWKVGYGYFGMTQVPADFVPSRSADTENGNVSIWQVLKGDTASLWDDGMHNVTVPGNLLNGQDLSLTVIKDEATGYKVGYAYLGVSADAKSFQAPKYTAKGPGRSF